MRAQLVAIGMLMVGMFAIHGAFANEYYRMEQSRLQTIACTAAYVGARLLPFNPRAATRTANAYAEMNGIPARDIVLVEVAGDQRSLTVELSYKIPLAFAIIEWKVDQYLTVTARANLQPSIPEQLNVL